MIYYYYFFESCFVRLTVSRITLHFWWPPTLKKLAMQSNSTWSFWSESVSLWSFSLWKHFWTTSSFRHSAAKRELSTFSTAGGNRCLNLTSKETHILSASLVRLVNLSLDFVARRVSRDGFAKLMKQFNKDKYVARKCVCFSLHKTKPPM